jgi:hypothetical protein
MRRSLPEITDAIFIIDGASQPGFSGTPLIEMDTSHLMPPGIAFTFGAGGSANIRDVSVIPAAAVPEPS